nr:hypothetical protein [Tanacetum cinerariifolium]
MVTLQFADTHNMVAFLSKPTETDGFEQIVDFLNAHPIRYVLTVNPTIYISCFEQSWSTTMAKTINGEVRLHAKVDGKKIIVTDSSVKRDLLGVKDFMMMLELLLLRGPHETFQCQPTNEDYCYKQNSCYNSNSFGSDHCQPPQYTVDHAIFNAHNDFLKTQNELLTSQNTIMKQMIQLTSMCELACQIVQKKQEEKWIEEEQAAKARYWRILAYCDDDDDYDSAITTILSTEEPVDSLSMGDEHLDTIPATESDEVIKSSVKNLVPIPSEFEGIPDTMCDVHLDNNHTPLEAKDHLEIVLNSNDDISSSDDDSLYEENIEYIEASPHDSELVSLEAAEIVIPEVEEIEDDNLRKKLLNVHLLIANIEALKDNPTQSFELLTKSSSTSLVKPT